MFTTDSRTENFLTQMGAAFRYTNAIAATDLLPDWDTVNLARPVPKREEAIVEYASLMENGSAAPAPILLQTPQGYSVLDGIQRISAAFLAGFTRLTAYVVTCDSDKLVLSIRVLANARLQGRAEPIEWTRRRAVEILVVQQGLSVAEVAKMGGWRPADIERIATAIAWNRDIRDIGGPEDLPDTIINVIAKHTTREELPRAADVTAEFLRAIKQGQFAAADAEPFIETYFQPVVKVSRTYATYKERLEDFRKDPEFMARTLGRKVSGPSPDVNFRRILRSAGTVLDELIASGQPVPFVDEFFHILGTLKDKLQVLSKRSKQAAKTGAATNKRKDVE